MHRVTWVATCLVGRRTPIKCTVLDGLHIRKWGLCWGPRRGVGSSAPVLPDALVVVLGRPGSGKGTVCRSIVTRHQEGAGPLARAGGWRLETCSAGALLREEMEANTAAGEVIRRTLEEGKIVDAAVTLPLLKARLMQEHAIEGERTCFLLDGFPRSLAQGLMFEQEVMPYSLALHLAVNDLEALEERLLARAVKAGKEARADDNLRSIRQRFQVHATECDPVVAYFREKGIVEDVDGDRSSARVTEAAEKVLARYLLGARPSASRQ